MFKVGQVWLDKEHGDVAICSAIDPDWYSPHSDHGDRIQITYLGRDACAVDTYSSKFWQNIVKCYYELIEDEKEIGMLLLQL